MQKVGQILPDSSGKISVSDIYGHQVCVYPHHFALGLTLLPTLSRLRYPMIGGKETLGGLERWFSPRGQDLAFLLSRIGLIRPRSVLI
jgi:hypothetical protein